MSKTQSNALRNGNRRRGLSRARGVVAELDRRAGLLLDVAVFVSRRSDASMRRWVHRLAP